MTATPGSSRTAWKLCIVLGALVAGLAGFFVITTRGILNANRFADNVATSLGDDRVASFVSDQITDAIIASRPNLLAVRPVLVGTVESVVRSRPFRAIVERSARATHRFFFEQAGQEIIISLPDVGTIVRGAVSQASPDLAAKIPPGIEAQLTSGKVGKSITQFIKLWKMGDRLLILSWIMFDLGLALLIVGIALAPNRQVGLRDAGIALVAVALAYLAVVPASRLVIMAVFHGNQELGGFVHGVIKAFLHRLRGGAVVLGAPGLLLLAAGTATLDRVDPLVIGRETVKLLTTPPSRTGLKLLWVLGLLLLGVVALVWPLQLVYGLIVLLGIGLVQGGLRELFRMIPGRMRAMAAMGSETEAAGASRWGSLVSVAVVIFGISGLAAWLVLRGGEASATNASVVPATCNGSTALCDRTVDEIVWPAAHNAMSNATVEGWMFPHHPHDMVQMLDDGIRALAIDIHYGIPTAGRVKTDIDHEVSSRDKIAQAMGDSGVAAAMRIRDRMVGQAEGPQGLYFCHGFCELGGYLVGPEFTRIREWLDRNPGEVIMMVIEDYVTVQQMDSLFKASGLFEYVYTGSVTNWSTLRDMIAANQRLIVFIESGHPGIAYMRPAFATFQETPYTFHKPEDFSCRPNRGGTNGNMFLMNHWIETTPAPRPTNADSVNAYDFLLARARKCERERHHLVNLLQVDFYSNGDVVRVARTLNGLDTAAVAAARP